MSEGKGGYRGDIDGLRALAIIPVVAYHVGVAGFSGGFVGVDVFFVISGFLITGLLLNEQRRDGRIDIFEFYARRVRRLLPAMALVLLTTLVASALILPVSGPLQDLATSALATSLFSSNLYFWQVRNDYFSAAADIMPLLHTWTLAVEEQFYVVWPVGMIVLAAIARALKARPTPFLAVALVFGVILSFALSQVSTLTGPSAASFFLSSHRAWELGIGALLAVAALGKGPGWLGSLLTVGGLAAIVASVTLFNEDTLFPGLAVLAPVLGSAAVIAGGALAPGNPASRLLSAAPFTAIGKLSYSWYLWHWPLLALARAPQLGERSMPRDLALAAAALVLAAITYRLVETPIRVRKIGPFATTRGALLSGLAIVAVCAGSAAGLLLWSKAQGASEHRFAHIQAARTTRFGPIAACHHFTERDFQIPPTAHCLTGAPPPAPAVLLRGDSDAQQLLPPLTAAGQAAGVSVIARTATQCRATRTHPSGSPARRAQQLDCIRFNQAISSMLDEMIARNGLKGVVMAGLWSDEEGLNRQNLQALAEQLHGKGLRLLIVAETPSERRLTPDCLSYRSPAACTVPRADIERRHAERLAIFQAVAAAVPDVRVFDPTAVVCSATECPSQIGETIVYRDITHLSHDGSMLLEPELAKAIAWAAGG